MRRKLILFFLALCAMSLLPTTAWANDYLEKQNHFSVMATGQDVIHFVVPVYAYGAGNDYYVHKTSYIYIDNITRNDTAESGTVTIAKAYSKRSDDDPENKKYSEGKGSAYLEMSKGRAIVTSTYSGINEAVNEGQSSGKMLIRTVEDDGCDHVTKLEFDWYPPTELNGKKFRINMKMYIYRNQANPKDNNQSYTFDWHFDNSGQKFSTNDNMVAPQLMTPFLYTVTESGAEAGFGAAAVPYMAFQNVFGYYSSLNPNTQIPVKDRSGMIYVQTTDTVQPAFSAKFEVERNTTTHERVQINSNTINIPPYHRIYDFEATSETDNMGTYTGNHVLTWNIRNPQLADLMDGDMFEVERALKSDFSDAQQVTVTSMSRNRGSYTFVDNNRSTWTGNATTQSQTFNYHATYRPNYYYTVFDQNGNAKFNLDVVLTNEKVQVSSVPVYYRIRRASASVWGWDNELVKTATLQNINYLAPLAATQENYSKDADYETNHKVNFRFKIENSDAPGLVFPADGFNLSLNSMTCISDSVTVRLEDITNRSDRELEYSIYRYDRPIQSNVKFHGNGTQEFKVPTGATIKFHRPWYQPDTKIELRTSRLIYISFSTATFDGYDVEDQGMLPEDNPWTPELQQHLLDSLSPLLVTKYQTEYGGGKSMWDNSAKLVLTRTIQETGQTMEFTIPADSIRRQQDGSWIATYSDVADRACSHYSYTVRIDQSEADLHVADTLQLQPKTITGPDLYFDESATVTRFTATQGDASTAMKNGVLLRWQVNSDAVDSYVLTRIRKGSDASADTLYVGDNTDYFDRTALPDVHYDYTIATRYSCNGKSTSNAATTEGWRTPYGEISGTIRMTDNSGMAGVNVALQDTAGNVLRTMTTDASGFFRFDSLTYDGTKGTDYAIIPTSQYGTFVYNNTSAPTATVSLTVAEAVGSGIDFVNTSSTRLSGRVLYKLSTIPVPGVMFLLNGDTVRRDNVPVTTGTDGNFELVLPLNQPCRLQVFKPGHVFEGDGILHVEQDKDTFSLTKPLDGVRFYDQTKVRLVGRVAGGNDQRDLQHGFGVGKNNLGDNLQLVLQIEGDNTAQLVHDPDDLSRDTINQTVEYTSVGGEAVVTNTLFEKKRIVLRPDPKTGEYAVDLFPVKYKVVQATATGYATLFAAGQGAETFDLVNAPLTVIHDTLTTNTNSNKQYTTSYNAVYDRIYHNPVVVSLSQVLYGVERKGFGEAEMEFSSLHSLTDKVAMYTEQTDGTVNYLMGYPVFLSGRKYQFIARAYEQYVYNNATGGTVDRVAQRGGEVTIHNGLHSQLDTLRFMLDEKGENRAVWLTVDKIDVRNSGTAALRTVSALLKTEGNAVETTAFQAFVSGVDFESGNLMDTESAVVLLDIIRDPAGMGSAAWVDAGSTYTFGYTESFYWNIGMDITLLKGIKVTQNIGTVSAPQGAGTYMGSNFETSRLLSIPIPISNDWSWGYIYNYSVTTDNRISTSPGMLPQDVGAPADVFYGTTISQLAGKFSAVAVISDSLFQARQPAINAGMMKVLGSGTAADGKQYHLVTGQKTALGSKVNNTFAYTQDYVINSLIPKLALERSNLLMNFTDSAAAQAYANQTGEPVYWNTGKADQTARTDSIKKGSYKMICPDDDKVYTNRIAALDNMIRQWVTILYGNEKEKVQARMAGSSTEVGTYSINAGVGFTHADVYSSTAAYDEMPQSAKLWGQQMASNASMAASTMASDWMNIANFFGTAGKDKIGETVASALKKIGDLTTAEGPQGSAAQKANQQEMGSQTNTSKFLFNVEPTTIYMPSYDKNKAKAVMKNCGFALNSDNMGDLTVAVYRTRTDSVWRDTTLTTRNKVGVSDPDMLYGSYVFYTVGGSTYCPHEDEEKTKFYNPGTVIGNATQWVCKPELSIDVHEQSAVMPDKRAIFHVTMMNNSSLQTGRAAVGNQFDLSINPVSNPNGARITMDGQSLTQPIGFFLTPGVPVTKTLEVERGTVDDYENLTLNLGLTDCPITFANLNFSVHFLPVSSDVAITSPRQNWVMNTLSPHDSIGYYLPIEIDGFDIHHKNFDHIEFQYKLSTQSDDAWVNQCSFYADDSLYALASGNKAMIENGRIVPFRFYGERDPKELNYDLRAVTFCRFGSGFVTKASPVISGVKDTRPPVLFGDPEPANGILGIGEHLRLRFSEPIAGNWLDEDNNFQLIGITNETSPTTDASPHFTGTADSYAASEVSRSLAGRSFSIDMMVKPTNPNAEVTFFSQGLEDSALSFGRTADNRLFLKNASTTVYSKALPDKMLEFTRAVVTYDKDKNAVRFFAGTLEVTDSTAANQLPEWTAAQAELVFGRGMEGNLLENRIWTKALTPEEVAATHMRYLTGQERELMAYYRMNEGAGTTLRDRASGATLTMHNASWNLPKGISLTLTSSDSVALARNLLSRSAVYDATYMLWFRPTSTSGTIFRAGDKRFALEDGKLVFQSGNQSSMVNDQMVNGSWHHLVWVINRTYNNVAVYLDGELAETYPADRLTGITGDMYLGGGGFEGSLDEFVLFEQALPRTFITEYGTRKPVGDEMGLMAYLPFEKQVQNPNGVLELVFSTDDQRIFRDANGKVVDKTVPLIIEPSSLQGGDASRLADKANYAPVSGIGLMSKLHFNWTYDQGELLINLLMDDYEVNHQPVLVTVRDVEDLNGNPMPSPVMWMATVDRNALRWYDNELKETLVAYGQMAEQPIESDFAFFNQTGFRHQFLIESLPEWLTVSDAYGSIMPLSDKTVRFTFSPNMPVGTYSDYVYLIDEKGLCEPLFVEYTVEAVCPYQEPDEHKYTLNMSLCGQVKIGDVYDTDSDDRVIALYNNECVGMANVEADRERNTSKVHMTIYGDGNMTGKEITFQLWQASTGRTFMLATDRKILFSHGGVYGCGDGNPVVFTISGSETQNIQLEKGWNWMSTHLNLTPDKTPLNSVIKAAGPWKEGDLIKNPANQQFSTYSEVQDAFVGSLTAWDYRQMYMIYTANGNILRLSGDKLPADSMRITLRGGGQWDALPCLLDQTTTITEAMADYFPHATAGDIIKSHGHFAYFSSDNRWEGDLGALRPGEGYLMRRMAATPVTFRFINTERPSGAPQHDDNLRLESNAATNMTMIARLDSSPETGEVANGQRGGSLRAYIGDQLVGVATPLSLKGESEKALFFLTISSDVTGTLRFETEDGVILTPSPSGEGRGETITYIPDSHHGTLDQPVLLTPVDDRPYKIIENGHIIIIRGGERYDTTGKKLE